jgi:hypothetical protein
MSIGIGDADAVMQLGSGVLAAARKANEPRAWPNVYESLVELYAILDEWCESASLSNTHITDRITNERYRETGEMVGFGGRQTVGFVDTVMSDSKSLLRPNAPWYQRWKSSKRRAAARRNLARILAVHAPDIVESFDRATNNRADWVRWREREFEHWLIQAHSDDEEHRLIREMLVTLEQLEQTRDLVASFVNERFPLGHQPSRP